MEMNARGRWNEKLEDAAFQQPSTATPIRPAEGGVGCVVSRSIKMVLRQQGGRGTGTVWEGGIQAELWRMRCGTADIPG